MFLSLATIYVIFTLSRPFLFQTDVEAAREAYDAFLSHYPYCYGYWRKYADYEKNKGDRNKCEEVSASGNDTSSHEELVATK